MTPNLDAPGLVGLGHMGMPVAGRLVACGRAPRVHDLDPARVQQAAALGATASASLAALVADCDVMLLSLPNPAVVCAVVHDVLGTARAGQVVIDLSTNDPTTARTLHEAAAARGVAYVDAPVSGGPSRAATGELTLMVGGDDAAVAAVRPLLASVGKQVEHVGASGAGCVAKLLNNYVALWNMVGVSQAFVAAAAIGVSPDRLYDVMNKSSGQSYSLSRNFPKIRQRDWRSNFACELAAKDLRLGLQLMHDAGLAPFAGPALMELFARSARDFADLDVAAIALAIETGPDAAAAG